ncbi:response regulator transcription factor [Parasphingopyxis marina]|uniref:Response regulator transcription factor n=1 Tax=Parasphingopyxis marina TaxID=2761622 RepID=A0A842I2K7_9SPHN|nr:response regulator transcription factor [Parasphingopyxis marina]MBC2779121.1 response regulator transcription factor [Parasphingopyxis marina]
MAKILVADDDPLLGEFIRIKLESGGHDVVLALDGAAALELADNGDFDLAVLDAMMPVLSGFEVAEKLRANPAHADLVLIMLTARKERDNVFKAMLTGIDDFLTKPFDPAELLVHVDNMLRPGGSLRNRAESA